MPDKNRYGTKVDRWLYAFCPQCDSSSSLSPGPLNDEETIEFRQCEEGHTVESEPTFWAPPGEATEYGIH